MGKIDTVLNHIMDIKEDVAGIKQHLKDMNGSIGRHEISINNLNKKVYWGFGVGSGILVIFGIAFKFLKS